MELLDKFLLDPKLQRQFSERHDKRTLQKLLAPTPGLRGLDLEADRTRTARLLSASAPDAGAHRQAFPSKECGTHSTSSAQKIISDRFDLGLSCNQALTCPCCHGDADVLGHHDVKRFKGPDISSRHNAIRDCVVKMHQEVGHKTTVEKVFYNDGRAERSGDYYEEESKTMFRSCTSSLVLRLYKPRKPSCIPRTKRTRPR